MMNKLQEMALTKYDNQTLLLEDAWSFFKLLDTDGGGCVEPEDIRVCETVNVFFHSFRSDRAVVWRDDVRTKFEN